MEVTRRWCVALLFVLLSATGLASAQGLVAFDHLERNIKSAQTVSPLTSELFGDRVSLFNGSTEFEVFDIDLPGNDGLPVRLGRRMSVGVYGTTKLTSRGLDPNPERPAGFERWELSVPYLRGTFDQSYGWNVGGSTQRCSRRGVPRVTTNVAISDVWSGVHLFLPGEGEMEILPLDAVHQRPSDGHAYYWGTKNQHRGRCIPSVTGMAGEGFEFVTPDGVTYRFDIASTVGGGAFERDGLVVTRETFYLLASSARDRFGNYVNFNYSGGRLQSITASDGRSISLVWDQNRVVSATAAGRTWHYSYGGPFRVTNPDGSTWEYEYHGETTVEFEALDANVCHYPLATATPYSITAKHPSGARAQFDFAYLAHVISGTPAQGFCIVDQVVDGVPYVSIGMPDFFSNYGLVSKQVTGPGLSPLQWLYDYGQPETGKANFSDAYCSFCDRDKPVRVVQPDGSIEEYQFGALWGFNSGELLAKYIVNPDGTVARSEIYTHVTDPEMAGMPFPSWHGGFSSSNDSSSLRQRPVRSTEIRQNGIIPGHLAYNSLSGSAAETCSYSVSLPANRHCAVVGAARVQKERRRIAAGGISMDPAVLIAEANGGRQAGALARPASTGGYDSFSTTVQSFDAFARPIQTLRQGPSGGSRTDIQEYYDHSGYWVLGRTARVINQNTGVVESQIAYGANALPYQIFQFGQLRQTLGYHADGTLASVTDGNGHSTHLSQWKRGMPQVIQFPATPETPNGATRTAAVNDAGWVTRVTDENGSSTYYAHDAMGRLARIDYPSNDSTGWHPSTQVFEQVPWDEHGIGPGHWRQTAATADARRVTYYDALWRPVIVEEYDASNPQVTRTFVRQVHDHSGRVTFASYPSQSAAAQTGVWTTYDVLGRTTSVGQDSEHGRLVTTTQYLPELLTLATSPKGVRTYSRYVAWGEPTYDFPIITDHASGAPEGFSTDIARDVFGKPTSILRRTYPPTKTLARQYVYHPVHQQLCKVVEPEGGATVMDYDGAGNLAWSASGMDLPDIGSCNLTEAWHSGRVVRRHYDARNRVTALRFPDQRGDTDYGYRPDGKLASLSVNNGSAVVSNAYSYNRRGLMVGEALAVDHHQWGLGYGYNSYGHLQAVLLPGGATIDYAPNALGRPSQAGQFASGVSYFPNGRLQQFTYGNGIVRTVSQNARGLPERMRDAHGAAAVFDESFDYDGHGNVATISDALPGHRGHRTMQYDALDRLVSVSSPMFGAAEYGYDILDNLTRLRVTGGTSSRDHAYIYDARNRLSLVTQAANGATVASLQHDAQGNVVQLGNRTFEFDFGNRLRAAPGRESYLYDGHGRRVKATDAQGRAIYSIYGHDGVLRYQRNERQGKTIEYVQLAGSLIAQLEDPIPLSTPQLTAPGYSANGHYTVSWTNSAYANRYELEEQRAGQAWQTAYNGAATQFAINGRAPGDWHYRVRACSATACGSWSATATVGVQAPPAAPVIHVPVEGPDGYYTVSWSTVPGALSYRLVERPPGGAWYGVYEGANTSSNAHGQPAGTWEYQVQACNEAGCGAWSSVGGVTVVHRPASAPTLSVPASNLTGDYHVAWSGVAGATRYELHEHGPGGWGEAYAGPATGWNAYSRTQGNWFYRVRACNGAGCGGWSAEVVVHVTRIPDVPPAPIVPAGITQGFYTVSWAPTARATSYQLVERVNGGAWHYVYDGVGLGAYRSGLGTGTWDYQVRACNPAGCSEWSTLVHVQVLLPPAVPTNLYAHNRTFMWGQGVFTGCNASWSHVAHATMYELSSTVVTMYYGPNNHYSGMSPNCSTLYTVRACNASGCSAWSPAVEPYWEYDLPPDPPPGDPGFPQDPLRIKEGGQ